MPVRSAAPSDAAALAGILNGIIVEGGLTAIETPLSQGEFREWFIDGPHCISCVVTSDGGGFQALERFHDDLPTDAADIATFVSAANRGRGSGRELAAATFAEAQRRGIGRIRAVIQARNAGAISYYRALGFEGSGEGDAVTLWRDV